MACRYLKHYFDKLPPEISGGSRGAQIQLIFRCELYRRRDVDEELARKCKEIPSRGPCWWWIENHPDIPDAEF